MAVLFSQKQNDDYLELLYSPPHSQLCHIFKIVIFTFFNTKNKNQCKHSPNRPTNLNLGGPAAIRPTQLNLGGPAARPQQLSHLEPGDYKITKSQSADHVPYTKVIIQIARPGIIVETCYAYH